MTPLQELEALIRKACPETMANEWNPLNAVLRLEHVLRAIGEFFAIAGDGRIMKYEMGWRYATNEYDEAMFYNLTKPLSAQSPEVIQFLLDIIK